MRRAAAAIALAVIALVAGAAVVEAATNDTLLVSRATGPAGPNADNDATLPAVSETGRFVAFAATSANLDAADPDQTLDVYVRDRLNNTTELISRASAANGGAKGNGSSGNPSISNDGRYVAFESRATNLDPVDPDDTADVFVRDRQTNTTTLVSRATNGDKADQAATFPSISGDGTHVAFQSTATNLSNDDGATNPDIYVRDIAGNTTVLASRAAAAANEGSVLPSLNGDGTRVAFQSSASNLHPDDPDTDPDIFVRDTQAGTTTYASRASGTGGAPADGPALGPSVDDAGTRVAFESPAANLDSGLADLFAGFFQRADFTYDVFVRDTATGSTEHASVGNGAVNVAGDGQSFRASISGDGRHVAYVTTSANLDPADTDTLRDVYVRDIDGLTTRLISRASNAGGAKGNDLSEHPALSVDGRFVAFASWATNLSPDDTDDRFDVLIRQTPPVAPLFTDTDPDSPANDNNPRIKGTSPSAATVDLFTTSDCTGAPAGTGTGAEFVSPGIEVTVADNTTTRFFGRATDGEGTQSICSPTSRLYIEESTTPAPIVNDTDPDSPSNDNNPRVKGTAAAGSTVRVYPNATCTGAPAAEGPAADFAGPGLSVMVGTGSTTEFHATAEAPGNALSACSSTFRTYVEDSFAPAAPEPTATNPPSPANHNSPRVRGKAEAGTTVELFDDPTCAGAPVADDSAAVFGGQGIEVTVGENTTTRFRARQTDRAGNVSPCSSTFVGYVERSTLPAPGATFTVTTSSDLVNDGCTPKHCTLREAIEASNTTPGRNLIAFQKGSTPMAMAPYGPLPDIIEEAIIEGETASYNLPDGHPDVIIDLSRGPGGSYVSIPNTDVLQFQLQQLFQFYPPPRAVRYDGLVVRAPDTIVSGVGVVGVDGHGIVLRDAPRSIVRSSSTIFQRFTFPLNSPPAAAGTTQIISRNLRDGIRVERSPDAVIGGDSAVDRNVLVYNAGNGISVDNESDDTLIEGNVIGEITPLFQLNPFVVNGNGLSGVLVQGAGANVEIGRPGDTRNVITRSGRAGIELRGGDTTVEDNWIGPGQTGGQVGIPLFGTGNVVGVLSTGATGNRIGAPGGGNVISGNPGAGVVVSEETRTARDVRIQANEIGPSPAGGGAILPNGIGVGVSRADGVLVGGDIANEANTIRSNGGDGVQVSEARVEVLGTTTHDHGGQGIDVLPKGPQVDDAGDTAEPQNRPVLEDAINNGAITTIRGHVDTAPGRQVRVEVFGQAACDFSGVGEGRELLGVDTVTGDEQFEVVHNAPLAVGFTISATATSSQMGTSEHSPCIEVTQDPPPDRHTVTTTDDVDDTVCDANCSLREAIDDANAAAGTDVIDFDIPGAGVQAIAPATALPTITGPTRIEGGTQRPDSEAPPTTPDVELRGNLIATAGTVGLHFTGTAGNSRVEGLIVNRFTGDGIRLDRADNSRIEDTHVGLAQDGSAAGNGGDGIELLGARVVTVARTVVSGNAGNGILATTASGPTRTSEQLTLQGSKVGTNVAGTAARPNTLAGVSVGANGSLIGGASPELGNVISANTGAGVSLGGTTTKVQNNRIGTSADGMSDLGNGQQGIHTGGTRDAVIGGGDGLGNLVSGNGGDGIAGFNTTGWAGTITHNKIGTDVGGGAAIANAGDGIDTDLSGRITDNVVSGNGGDGLHLDWSILALFGGTVPAIERNTIGRSAGGANAALPNGGDGVELGETFDTHTFGGPFSENVIASNGGQGLNDESQTNTFEFANNAIYDNGGLGIDKGEDGITENDPDDIVGPLNFPTITSARRNGTSTAISGMLESSPDFDTADLTFYSSPSCDPSGRGEGRTILGGATIDLDDDGDAAFDVTLPVDVPAGHMVTATHDARGFPASGTSEFSRCRRVPNIVVPDLTIDDAAADEGDSGRRNVPLTVHLSQATTAPVTVEFAVAGDTATSGRDMDDATGEVTVPVGATSVPIGVSMFGDTDPEGDEFAVVQLLRANGAMVAEGQGVLRIVDDDGAPELLELRAGEAQVTEGDGGTATVNVPVMLSRAPGGPVTVRYETVGLEAVSPADYDEESDTLTFGPSDTVQNVAIDVVGDAVDEGTERLFLSLSAPNGASITKPTGTVTVLDDDAPDPPPPPTPSPEPDPTPSPSPSTPAPSTPAPTPTRTPTPSPPGAPTPAPGVAAQNGCLNGPITGVGARMAQVSETDLCVEGPSDLARLGCLRRTAVTHRFGVTLKTVRRTRKGRVQVPRRRSLVTLVRFTLNGKAAGVVRRRPFVASIKGTTLKPGLNTLKASVRLRDPLKRGKVFRNRSLTFRFRSCA